MRSDDPLIHAYLQELVRIGFAEDEIPGLVLPGSVALEEFVEMLRAIPDGAGEDAYAALIRSLPWPRPAPWSYWPDPGDWFTADDFRAALQLINFSPLEPEVEEYMSPTRQISTWILAVMSLVSPALDAKVRAYIPIARRERLDAGESVEIADTAEEDFERQRADIRSKYGIGYA